MLSNQEEILTKSTFILYKLTIICMTVYTDCQLNTFHRSRSHEDTN